MHNKVVILPFSQKKKKKVVIFGKVKETKFDKK